AGTGMGLALYAIWLAIPSVIKSMEPSVVFSQLKGELVLCFELPKYHRRLEISLILQKEKYALGDLKKTLGSGTVDVFGQHQSLAIINGLNYRPRPAFQSFEAYTPYLIRRNYEYFLTSPPDFILFNLGTIDGRYPAQEDSLALASILTNYIPVADRFDHLILKKIPQERIDIESQRVLIEEKEIEPGEKLELPQFSGKPIWCVVETHPDIRSRLRAFFYQPEDMSVVIETNNGQAFQHRFLPGPASVGFIISPMLADNAEARLYFCGKFTALAESIKIETKIRMKSRIGIKFFSLPARAADPSICDRSSSSSQF
ncbi:MAG: hypothetical protein ACREGC_04330, partial [Minisyncoccia bacterium]